MATYYVTKAGNDTTGNGSVETPWLTCQKAEDTAANGDTVHVGAGTYVEDQPTTHGLRAAKAITWIADGAVTIKGTSTSTRPLYWEANTVSSFTGFTFDAETTRAAAVWLPSGAANKTMTNCTMTGATNAGINIASGTVSGIVFDGCTISGCTGQYAILGNGAGWIFRNGTITHNGNFPMFTDATGDISVTGNTITSTTAIGANANQIIRLAGASGTKTITNNVFSCVGVKSVVAVTAGGGTAVITGNTITVERSVGAAVISFDLAGWTPTVSNNTVSVTATAQDQPVISCTNVVPTVSGNTITTAANVNSVYHVQVLSTGTVVANAAVTNNTLNSSSPNGYVILLGTEESSANDGKITTPTVSGNIITLTNASGNNHIIMCGFVVNATVSKNRISSTGSGYGIVFKSVGTNAYTTGGAFYNLITGAMITGIRVRDQAGVQLYNNTIRIVTSTADVAVIHITGTTMPSTGAKVKNNIVANSGTAALIHNDTESLTNYESDYNVLYASGGGNIATIAAIAYETFAEWQGAGYDGNSYNVNPNFVSSANFHMNTRRAGVAIAGLTTDFDGQAVADPPNVGVYESVISDDSAYMIMAARRRFR